MESKEIFLEFLAIGEGTKFVGEVFTRGNANFNGQISGTIRVNGILQIGKNAVVKAQIQAEKAFVSGKIAGNLEISDSLEIFSTASLEGVISATSLKIEKGAVINGKIVMKKLS